MLHGEDSRYRLLLRHSQNILPSWGALFFSINSDPKVALIPMHPAFPGPLFSYDSSQHVTELRYLITVPHIGWSSKLVTTQRKQMIKSLVHVT